MKSGASIFFALVVFASQRRLRATKHDMPSFECFIPNEGHTLAGLIRPLLLDDPEEVTYAVVTDPMCDEPGIRIRAKSREHVLKAIEGAEKLLSTWKDRLQAWNAP